MQVSRNAISLQLPLGSVVNRAVVAELAQGLGPLRDLRSVFGSSSGVMEWYRPVEQDVKNIPTFTEFFKSNRDVSSTTEVLLSANISSRLPSKQRPSGDLELATHHQRSGRFEEM